MALKIHASPLCVLSLRVLFSQILSAETLSQPNLQAVIRRLRTSTITSKIEDGTTWIALL
ncbi:hypothetical protein PF002_g3885 [Phytophthora fragariae]|uniref:RxLR effector protein n=2 Tax=Phytophthora TaxID=4783 RepID=A0A6A3FQ63_9STRA|nr:hypothetical protein PF003_g1333 [Phytophthora fragariae]KAE9012433.1 hypothetical protein PR002_g14806 [Phytophthora rubi]KAE8946696.1 hypothetical protein PF009_g3703 [Phytophthora fragariae]KAE9026111.1 hypothetical protein PF011_g2728 [Phytophthora fragariae]KAE9153062.1 hypothetical protein PF006_g2786 [Phytophthora fragariae]